MHNLLPVHEGRTDKVLLLDPDVVAAANGLSRRLQRAADALRTLGELALVQRRNPKPPRQPRTPRVVEFLKKAIEWRRQLDAGEVRNQAEIARRESLTRARVTQVLALLRLEPSIQKFILSMPSAAGRPILTERVLRGVTRIADAQVQRRAFQSVVGAG